MMCLYQPLLFLSVFSCLNFYFCSCKTELYAVKIHSKINLKQNRFIQLRESLMSCLTLRLLMSYIYIYIYTHTHTHTYTYMEHLFLMFLDRT